MYNSTNDSEDDGADALKSKIAEGMRAADEQVGASGETHAETLLRIAESAELFVSIPGSDPFVTFTDAFIDKGRTSTFKSTAPVSSISFRRWLTTAFYEERDQPPSKDAMSQVINLLEALARRRSAVRVYNRVGVEETTGYLYLDLGTRDHRVVEVRPDGWSVISESPIKFARHKNIASLPEPRPGGSLNLLKELLNLPDDGDRSFVLVVAYLLVALRFTSNYFVLVILGEHGSAKTTFAKVLRRLIDPVITAPLRNAPDGPREVGAALAAGTHVIAFNNVSYLHDWLSDLLCMLATGDGVGWRKYYTDDDERLFDGAHPIILNGIEEFATRPDLLDRAIVLELETIPEERRRTEEELLAQLEKLGPAIFGALLDAMVVGLRELPNVRLRSLPRMADAAKWVVACETAGLWSGPPFMEVYKQAQAEASDVILEASPVASAFMQWTDGVLPRTEGSEYRRTPAQLLADLRDVAGEEVARGKSWPRTARALGGQLTRLASELRRRGIELTRPRANGVRYFRVARLRRAESDGSDADPEPGTSGTADITYQ